MTQSRMWSNCPSTASPELAPRVEFESGEAGSPGTAENATMAAVAAGENPIDAQSGT